MSLAQFSDAGRDRLRTLITEVEQELALLPDQTDGSAALPSLRAAWGRLVGAMALGPAPETRECPVCHGIGMRAATRCSRCWSYLTPLPSATEEAR